MLESLIITMREGVEAALIVGIVLLYLRRTQRQHLDRLVYAALICAFLASIGAAVLFSYSSFNPDALGGWLMLIAAALTIGMVWFMSRAARTLKGEIEEKIDSYAGAGSKLSLFLFVFLMVFREGAETVLVLAAVRLTTSDILSFLGTFFGIILSIVFGLVFVKGSIRVDLRKFFRITTVILIFVAAQLTISGFHELSEAGIIPSSKQQMAIIGPIVRNDVFFFITILALASLLVLFETRRRSDAPTSSTESKAEARKAAWSARREKFWSTAVYVSAFVFILMATAQFIYAKQASAVAPAKEVAFTNRHTTIDAHDILAGEAHYYIAQLNGKALRFLIYRKPDNKLAIVMDACTICGAAGYTNGGAQGLICRNCSAPINPQSVGEGGGCNPIPLTASIQGDTVTVTEKDLKDGAAQIKE